MLIICYVCATCNHLYSHYYEVNEKILNYRACSECEGTGRRRDSESENVEDDSLHDNTDFAHPAFWRGQLSGVHGVCKKIEDILDGIDGGSGVSNNECLEKLRRRLLDTVTKLIKISEQQDVILKQQVSIQEQIGNT